MQWIVIIVADLAQSETLLGKNVFLSLPIVDDLNGDFVGSFVNVECQRFLPLGVHVTRRLNDLRVLGLLTISARVVLVDEDFDHGLEAIRIKELVVELSIDYVEIQGATLHDRLIYALDMNLKAGLALLDITHFALNFLNLSVETLYVFSEELDVVLSVLKRFELRIYELLLVDLSIPINVHVVVQFIDSFILKYLTRLLNLVRHEAFELNTTQEP